MFCPRALCQSLVAACTVKAINALPGGCRKAESHFGYWSFPRPSQQKNDSAEIQAGPDHRPKILNIPRKALSAAIVPECLSYPEGPSVRLLQCPSCRCPEAADPGNPGFARRRFLKGCPCPGYWILPSSTD